MQVHGTVYGSYYCHFLTRVYCCSGFRELKEWKAAQEARRIKREKTKAANSPKQVLTSSDMTHYRRNGPGLQENWKNGHKTDSSVQNGVRNSNQNNSRSSTKPQSFVVPTPTYCNDHYTDDDDDLIDDDIYDTVIEQDFSSIKSLPLTNDIVLTSAPLKEDDIEVIYDSAEGVLETESGDYCNCNDEDIYDDISVRSNQPLPSAIIIEENIYDDTTCVDTFRNSTSVVSNPPHHRQPLPPPMSEDEALYSDAASLFQAPTQNTFQVTVPEDDEDLYTDASSVFNKPPTNQGISQVKPCSAKVSHEYPSETFTCLSNMEVKKGMSIIESEETRSGFSPIAFRSANMKKIGKARSIPTIVPETLPCHPRRSSEQLAVTPLSKPPPSPPRNKRGIARKRSKAIKSRSDSESSNMSPNQSLSPRGSVGGSDSRISSNSSYSEVFSSLPPLVSREDRRHSELTEKMLLPTIRAGVTVTNFNDEPIDEDYAEIDNCHELSYPTSSLPQEYLTPIKQKPHQKLKQSKSADVLRKNHPVNQYIDTRPQAPLPSKTQIDNPPPKPPRTRNTLNIADSPKHVHPSPPLLDKKTMQFDARMVPPPPIPSRHTRCADTPTIAPPPLPVRKTPMPMQSSKNTPPFTQALSSSTSPPLAATSTSTSSGPLSSRQNVQLKKVSAKPPSKIDPKQEATDSTGSLMTQMQAFKLRKTTEEAHSSPVPLQVPRHKRPTPPLPNRQGAPFHAVTSQEPKINNDVPDWKKNLIEKKRRTRGK